MILGLEQYYLLFDNKPISDFRTSLCFYGNKNIGKFDFALELVKSVVTNEQNIHIISLEENKSSISIEQIRTLLSDLNTYPYQDKKHYIIINHAEKLNDVSANALLKNLEEPKQTEQFILICSDYSNMLDTIKSRCYNISITPDISKLINMIKSEDEITRNVLLKSGITYIKEYIQSDTIRKQYADIKELCISVLNSKTTRTIAKHSDLIMKSNVYIFFQYLKELSNSANYQLIYDTCEQISRTNANVPIYIDILLYNLQKPTELQ